MSEWSSTAERQQAIADLKAARAELVARGRCRGQLVNEDRQVCVRGAVGVVISPKFEEMYLNPIYSGGIPNWARELSEDWQRVRRVESVLQAHVPGGTRIELWNDDPETTDEDVLNLFDKALAELGGLA